MPVAIAIIAILCAAAVTLLLTANRRGATTGRLGRETRKRDLATAGTAVPPAEAAVVGAATSAADATGDARLRARETRAALDSGAGLPAAAPVAPVEAAEAAAPSARAGRQPLDDEELGVTRRQFLNRGIVALIGFNLAAFGASCLAFIWPVGGGGFGGKVKAGKLDDILAEIADKRQPFYVPEARSYITVFPKERLKDAEKSGYAPALLKNMEQGVMAVYQKCPHLGCRVPWCHSSQWFECPCHGSKYNRIGEKRDGPAPRGMSMWPMEIAGGAVVINTSGTAIDGMPIGADTTGQKPEGPSCV